MHQLSTRDAEDMQEQSPPKPTPGAIQELDHPEEELEDPTAGAAAVYTQALQEPGTVLRAQVAPRQHARHHRRLPALPTRAPR